MKLSRREFAKANAAAIAAAAAGLPLVTTASNLITEADMTRLDWNKAPCRFCGTGCSVMVATRDNRVVATHGDVKAEVNRGLNCVKGYFLSKIMYGVDRLNQPLLRMKNGVYDKQGEFQPVSWEQAFDIMEQKTKEALREHGPEAVGMFGSGQWTVWEGYAANKLMKAGFRSNNIDPNARHCMASAVMGFMRTFGMDEPMGCYDDIEQADAFVLWGSNMAEMHPILWSRVTDRRLSHPNTKVAVLSTFEHRSFDLADIPMVFKPQTDLIILNYIANHIIQSGAVNQDFVKRHTRFAKGADDIGYGLLPNRTFGYGHSFGVLSHYYGREAGLELREDIDTVLEPGMVFTIEPGLYFKEEDLAVPEEYRGIGVRIEDDVLVTKTGCEIITGGVPKTVAEIEALMAAAREQAA